MCAHMSVNIIFKKHMLIDKYIYH